MALDRPLLGSFDRHVAPAALRDSVGNLPAELTTFVGRRAELSQAKALLSSGRLLTLTGMGGVGKTRMARRLVADVQRAFPDGVWQVELAELWEPTLVAASIATALGLRESAGRWTVATLEACLADREILLLLDNCEHLIDACAVTVDALLRACPGLHIVATSREPLAIDGEQTLQVPPLSTPNPKLMTDATRLEEFDAVRLFIERAGAALPGFAVNSGNGRSVAELCHRLDGLPLALEFAALRIRALSPSEIVAWLDKESSLSAGGSRIAPSRQQTLRALVDWSFQLCSQQERALWCWLSVFVGSFSLAAAQGVSVGTPVRELHLVDLIVGLVEKSVLARETCDGQIRYRMPESIREFGREQLIELGEDLSARRAHLDWYVLFTKKAYEAFAGPDQLQWFTQLRLEHGDIRAALEFALGQSDSAGDAADVLVAVPDYWLALGFVTEGRHWLDRLLRQAPDATLYRARALRADAYLAAMQGDYSASTGALAEAQLVALRAGSDQERGWHGYVGGIKEFVCSGDFAAASRLLDDGVTDMRAADDLHGLIDILGCHAMVAAMSGDQEAAETRAREFLAVAEPLGERWVRSYVLWALGILAWRVGDPGRAAALEIESLKLRLPFDGRMGLAMSAEVLAWITAAEEDQETAAVLLGAAMQAAAAIGTSVQFSAFMADDHLRCEALVRGQLGEARFEAALGRGRQLTPDQVLELVTNEVREHPAVFSAPEVDTAALILTRREREIAELIGQGMSNKEIAARLVISLRTAEGHVEHILQKLGFTSRARVAAWVAERPSL